MKKLNIRPLLFSFLIIFSLGSYVYVNNVTITKSHMKCNAAEITDDEDRENKEMMLPEVQLVKKILEKGREFLPATRF